MNDIKKNTASILIVDDTPKNIQVLGIILKQEGYQISVAQNGLQALKVIDKILPDLIILDIMMPELDGFEMCQRLKNSERTKDIPIIFLTAKTESNSIIKGFELGAMDYITKPFNSKELLARVHTHLELKFTKDIIQKISNERKELLHILCHDLANPMNSILTVLNLMRTYQDFKEMRELLVSSVENGLEVITLVREMRSLEEHKLKLIVVNLAKAITESSRILSKKFSDKQIELRVDVDEQLDVYVERVSFVNSVLNNLFTNAIKFSYSNSKVIVNAKRSTNSIELFIQDFGIGMPVTLLQDVFNVSKTTSRPGTGRERGTGFGMPLVKKFVDAYGGTIEVFSKEEKLHPQEHGTLVKMTLPQPDSLKQK
jgi:CheY-like chemotaxis protein